MVNSINIENHKLIHQSNDHFNFRSIFKRVVSKFQKLNARITPESVTALHKKSHRHSLKAIKRHKKK